VWELDSKTYAWNSAADFDNAPLEPAMSQPDAPQNPLALLPRFLGRALVTLYRYTLSPIIGPRCRHMPACSEYADEAIARFGLWAGAWIALARILRCQPWGTHGLDFVSAAAPSGARWYLPWRYGRWRGTNEVPPPRSATR
jgi:putative membrane protein insertion efficiency factor